MRPVAANEGPKKEEVSTVQARRKLSWVDWIISGAMVLLLVLTVIPLLNTLALSFSSNLASVQPGIHLWPKEWSLQAYTVAWRRLGLWRPFLNSLFVTTVGTFLHMFLGAMAAYTMLQKDFPARRLTVLLIFLTMSVPGEAIMVPLYIVVRSLGLLNTYTALIVSGLVSGFTILLLFNYFRTVPASLAEAARIDGAGDFTISPGCTCRQASRASLQSAYLEIVGRWNQFTAPLLYLTDHTKFTVQLALRSVVVVNDSSQGWM